MQKKMELCFCFYLSFAVLLLQFSCSESIQEAKSGSADIIIGGLFPIHESVNAMGQCNRFSVGRLAQSLMMVHAIEQINQKKELGDIKLGYHILDSCADVTTALKNSLHFMQLNKSSNTDEKQQLSPPVKAVIGDYYSEISIAVTRQLNLEEIPQISYGSTSGFLSDKTRFPSFLRTVPQDDHQAHAIIEILMEHNWNWVGIVATDSEYGRYAVERLQHHAASHDICFAYIHFLPEFLVDKDLKESIGETVKSIVENKNVSVIVSFAKPDHMMYIFNNVLRHQRGKKKIWIASDNWSQSVSCLNTTRWSLRDVGTVFGMTLKSGNTSRFERFLRNIDKNPDMYQNNSFLTAYLSMTDDHVSGSNMSRQIQRLIHMTYPYAVFSIELAVNAIAQAVKNLCNNNRTCASQLKPRQLRDALGSTEFSIDGKKYSFNKDCDVDSGYDIILWRYTSPRTVDMNYKVAHYDIQQEKLMFDPNIESLFHQTKGVSSVCSRCNPGEWKIRQQGQPVCCFECKKCPENHYSNVTDALLCLQCDNTTHYSEEGSQSCTVKETVFLEWKDIYHIVLLASAALGVVLTLVVGIIFLASWNTPVVRSSVGPIALLLLFSILLTFGSVVIFGGKPNDWQCKTRQVLFGLSFTLSVSCILVKSFKIILAFEFDPVIQDRLDKLYKPYLIIPFCMLGQVVICTVWLVYMPPIPMKAYNIPNTVVLKCNERLFPAFGAMLAYIGLLAIICFIIAFKGRKLPQSYNEAKFITFSMLIYLIAWIIFGPVYKNITGRYHSAIEMTVILISAYGILFCLFLTKCYIILCRRSENTTKSFRADVTKFAMGKDSILDKKWPKDSSGIFNEGLSLESLPSPEPLNPVEDRRESINSIMKPSYDDPLQDSQPSLLDYNP
ncbi:PREDICTED: G-protein coupled receptor family C group 6 member A-like [Cyprinodon variegatus]|uniref:G-protein coupled receptor family C group 6 member A n=1 Tax=Cyprinodon variegatus TaxID=28743 RepID=A0A3Q2FKN7_CYPVA|nr:PREDICTED: G-protein coupled receptor family C group 6 member A-like [Cyprinodon variegatus]